MKMNQKSRGNDNFETPKYIFEQLDRIFDFELDCAATHDNALCTLYMTEWENALIMPWDKRTFCNPPFSKKAAFIEKAYNDVTKGICPVCVMILPLNSMDTRVWHKFIEGQFYYEILEGRISFINPGTGIPQKGNNSGTVIVYFKQKIKTKEQQNDRN